MIKAINKKEMDKKLEEIYGVKLPRGQVIQWSKEKLRIFTGDVSERELNFLASIVNVEIIGLYFAFQKDNELRFSFDSLFLAKDAKKNILEINGEQFKQWISGQEIEINEEQKAGLKDSQTQYILLKYKDDVIGCGKYTQTKVLNFIPKERRLRLN